MHRFETESIEPLLQALQHPVRAQVLTVLNDRNASAAELAEIVGEPIGKVRYHLRALSKSGLIGWEEAKDRRGVREYFWVVRTSQVIEDEQFLDLTPEQIRMLAVFGLRLMFNDATTALREGAFARRNDHCLTRFRPQVDERGWKELVKVYRSAIEGIERVTDRASTRLERSGEEPVLVSAVLMLFDLEGASQPLPSLVPPQQ